jgi:23S rRNA-/tRNA-specific pseudouridylate synthase
VRNDETRNNPREQLLPSQTSNIKHQSPSIINGVERPGIVHRLDKDTSGLIIIAKNDKAMHALQLKIAKRTIQKTYLALVL